MWPCTCPPATLPTPPQSDERLCRQKQALGCQIGPQRYAQVTQRCGKEPGRRRQGCGLGTNVFAQDPEKQVSRPDETSKDCIREPACVGGGGSQRELAEPTGHATGLSPSLGEKARWEHPSLASVPSGRFSLAVRVSLRGTRGEGALSLPRKDNPHISAALSCRQETAHGKHDLIPNAQMDFKARTGSQASSAPWSLWSVSRTFSS